MRRLPGAGRPVAGLLALLVTLLTTVLAVRDAGAHVTGTGLARVAVAGDMVSYRLTLALDELPPDAAQALRRAMNRDIGGAETVSAWLGEHVTVTAGAQACRPVRFLMQGAAAGQSSASVEVGFKCPDPTGMLVISDRLAAVFGDHYRTIVSLRGPDGSTQEQVLQDQTQTASFDMASATRPAGWFDFIRLGALHIATGFDHLLFLAALMLGARGALRAAAVVTAFTIAHSITLAMAAFGQLAVAPAIIEPLIAVSIIWAGVRIMLGRERDRGGWLLSFGFGLVHGLGFAGGLAELALPRASLLRALIGFNLGVEAAQLLLVLVTAPLWWWLWRQPAKSPATRIIAAVVIVAGACWLVERLLVQ